MCIVVLAKSIYMDTYFINPRIFFKGSRVNKYPGNVVIKDESADAITIKGNRDEGITYGSGFKHLISTYRITVYHGSDIILIEKEVRLSWLCRFIKGREYEWRRVYLGHVFLLQDCLHFIMIL